MSGLAVARALIRARLRGARRSLDRRTIAVYGLGLALAFAGFLAIFQTTGVAAGLAASDVVYVDRETDARLSDLARADAGDDQVRALFAGADAGALESLRAEWLVRHFRERGSLGFAVERPPFEAAELAPSTAAERVGALLFALAALLVFVAPLASPALAGRGRGLAWLERLPISRRAAAFGHLADRAVSDRVALFAVAPLTAAYCASLGAYAVAVPAAVVATPAVAALAGGVRLLALRDRRGTSRLASLVFYGVALGVFYAVFPPIARVAAQLADRIADAAMWIPPLSIAAAARGGLGAVAGLGLALLGGLVAISLAAASAPRGRAPRADDRRGASRSAAGTLSLMRIELLRKGRYLMLPGLAAVLLYLTASGALDSLSATLWMFSLLAAAPLMEMLYLYRRDRALLRRNMLLPVSPLASLTRRLAVLAAATLAVSYALVAYLASTLPGFLGAGEALLLLPIAGVAVGLCTAGCGVRAVRLFARGSPAFHLDWLLGAPLLAIVLVFALPGFGAGLPLATAALLLVALGLWQRNLDRSRWALDPTEPHPPGIGVIDFVVAAATAATAVIGAGLIAPDVTTGLVVQTTAAALAALAIARWRGVTPRQLLAASRLRASRIALLVAAAEALSLVVSWLVQLLYQQSPELVEVLDRNELLFHLDVATVIITVVLAPVSEELLFRGLLFRGARRRWGFWPSALLSASAFALLHPSYDAATILVFGLALAYLVERTGSLRPAIALHAINNGLAVIVTGLAA